MTTTKPAKASACRGCGCQVATGDTYCTLRCHQAARMRLVDTTGRLDIAKRRITEAEGNIVKADALRDAAHAEIADAREEVARRTSQVQQLRDDLTDSTIAVA